MGRGDRAHCRLPNAPFDRSCPAGETCGRYFHVEPDLRAVRRYSSGKGSSKRGTGVGKIVATPAASRALSRHGIAGPSAPLAAQRLQPPGTEQVDQWKGRRQRRAPRPLGKPVPRDRRPPGAGRGGAVPRSVRARGAALSAADVILHLRGKNIACWCKPGAVCHGDVLLKMANGNGGIHDS